MLLHIHMVKLKVSFAYLKHRCLNSKAYVEGRALRTHSPFKSCPLIGHHFSINVSLSHDLFHCFPSWSSCPSSPWVALGVISYSCSSRSVILGNHIWDPPCLITWPLLPYHCLIPVSPDVLLTIHFFLIRMSITNIFLYSLYFLACYCSYYVFFYVTYCF